MMRLLYFLIITLCLFSCNQINNPKEKYIIESDYSIEISFSSFWDCGEFQKIILNNRTSDDSILKEFNLYTINIKGNCKPPIISDTIATILSKSQSDSLFELANHFVNNFKLNNHVKPNQKKILVQDGASIKIEICLGNKCKSITYNHYRELNDISPDMNILMKYVDNINKKK
jgi:hypothetical protein